jgi:RHS repeat-associated protein
MITWNEIGRIFSTVLTVLFLILSINLSAQTVTNVATVGHLAAPSGLAWNTVTAGQQFFINEFEIVKLTVNTAPEYQYNLKDHLGNVRLTFTTAPQPAKVFTAGYEDVNSTTEAANFNPSYNNAVRYSAALYNRTPGGVKSQRLSAGNSNEIIGLAKSLQVIPGDTLKMEVYVKFTSPTTTNSNVAGLILGSMSTAFGVSGSSTGDGGLLYQSLAALNNVGGLINSGPDVDGTRPKAFINYLLFDENFVPYDGGFTQVPANALETGSGITHKLMQLQKVVPRPGYAYVYLSNENDKLVDVYFDDLKITHSPGPVVQSDEYYPFGLTFNSYQRENSNENRFLYNQGTGEKTFKTERIYDLGLNVDQTKYRTYDYLTGRWWQVDPKADEENLVTQTPYNYSYNNPIFYNDPEGDCPRCIKALAKTVVKSVIKGKVDLGEVYDVIDAGKTLIDPSASILDKGLAVFDVLSPVSSKELKAGAKLLGIADGANDAAKAGRKADYIVTSDGTAVSTDLKKVKEGFDKAGFKQVEANSDNVIYEVPKASGGGTFYSRLQQGKNSGKTDFDGDRIINTRNDGNTRNRQYVNPDGSRIPGTASKDKRKEIGHIHLEPKIGN